MVGLDGAIPTKVFGVVGVAAREGSVVTAGDTIVAAIAPINIPAVDSAST